MTSTEKPIIGRVSFISGETQEFTQHRRSKTCSGCGASTYDYANHSYSYGSWVSDSETQHKRTKTCSACGDSGYGGLQFAPNSLGECAIDNLHFGSHTAQIRFCGKGRFVSEILINGEHVVGTNKIPYDLLREENKVGLWGISLCTSLAGCLALTTWQIRRRREEESLQIIEK